MADNANGGLVQFSMQPGRIDDFLKGMKESADDKTKAAVESLGVMAGVSAWSAFRKYMKRH